MDKLNQSFPDPAQFREIKEFNYAALAASAFKKVIAELLNWIESQKDVVKQLGLKEKGLLKDKFEIGKE